MNNEAYIARCIQLSKNGFGKVSPNPMVGCVIVHNGEIIGEGYHQNYGEAHAEVNAINTVKDTSLLKEATLYVSLEPCAHFGKTPPCADLIIHHQIPKVVIGCIDTFSEVSGKGIERLRSKNVDVTVGVMDNECIDLNKRFFTFHNKKRPYIILKWAQSKDGFMDKLRTESSPTINWITQPETQQLTHLWRSQEDAILVGKTTVLNDNPSLTVRAIEGRNSKRFILAKQEEIPSNYDVCNNEAETHFIEAKTAQEICDVLYQHNIQSVIIEGGKQTLETFIAANIWDEARVLTGDVLFNDGLKSPTLSQAPITKQLFGKDILETFINV
jgi:diaminohydroxyphosphoribosylaminopyrimidine deaminase / 5-amino-6-(5-phosphoribosylamino)uracil reductase